MGNSCLVTWSPHSSREWEVLHHIYPMGSWARDASRTMHTPVPKACLGALLYHCHNKIDQPTLPPCHSRHQSTKVPPGDKIHSVAEYSSITLSTVSWKYYCNPTWTVTYRRVTRLYPCSIYILRGLDTHHGEMPIPPIHRSPKTSG